MESLTDEDPRSVGGYVRRQSPVRTGLFIRMAAPSSQLVEPGTVYRQSPVAGRAEPKGTVIEIFVQPEASGTASTTNPFGVGF